MNVVTMVICPTRLQSCARTHFLGMTTKRRRYVKKLARQFDKIEHDERSRFGIMRRTLERVAHLDRLRYDMIVAAGRITASDRDWIRTCIRPLREQKREQRAQQRRERAQQQFNDMTRTLKRDAWTK